MSPLTGKQSRKIGSGIDARGILRRLAGSEIVDEPDEDGDAQDGEQDFVCGEPQ
jgi:hypothetical protein